MQTEEQLRGQVSQLSAKLLSVDGQMRSKDEEIYKLRTENGNLMTDLKNLASMEQTIRVEIMGLTRKRAEQEELIQQMKNKILQDATTMRRATNELDAH
jgi:chromosome segregation ATPase